MSLSLRAGDGAEGSLLQTTGAVLGSAGLFALAHTLGYVGPLVAAVSPLPLIIHRLGRGAVATFLAALLATSLVAAFFTTGSGLVFFAFLLLPGLVIGEAMARGRGLARGCQWAFALLAVEIGAVLLFSGGDLSSQVSAVFEKHIRDPQDLQELRSMGYTPEAIELWVDQSKVLEAALRIVYPAVFVIGGGLLVLLNAFLLKAYLLRRDPGWLSGGEFEGIRWSLALPVLFIIAGLGVLVPPVRPAAYNLLLLVAFFLILEGLAVVAFFAHRLAGPPFLRKALIVLVLVNLWANTWAPLAVAFLGLLDIFFDFRKWGEPGRPEATV
jgi:uncharacterized protein YybS (DUF2232 family)